VAALAVAGADDVAALAVQVHVPDLSCTEHH
jgi:hypothetical protein